MSTARSRIRPARRVLQPRLERALVLVPGLVVLVGRRVQLGVEAEEQLWLEVQQAQAAEIYEELIFCQRKQTYKCL